MLQIRQYRQFKDSEIAILIAGDQEGIAAFRTFLSKWDGSPVDVMKECSTFSTTPNDNISHFFLRVSNHTESARISETTLTWSISESQPRRIIDLCDGLLGAKGSGHQYLNNDGEAIDIILSKDEYKLI